MEKEKVVITEQRLCDLQGFHDTLKISLDKREKDLSALQKQLEFLTELQGQLQGDYKQSQDDYRKVLAYSLLPWWKKWNSALPLLEG